MQAEPSFEAELDVASQKLESDIAGLIEQLSVCGSAAKAKTLQENIQQLLSLYRKKLRELDELADEQDRVEDTERLLLVATQRKKAYEALQVQLRRANLQVRKNAQQAAADERRALLGSPDPLDRQRRLRSEAELASAAEDITASLQRTRQQMTQELEHTGATLAAMEMSDNTLKAAKDEFSAQKSTHKRSRQLLGTMRRHSVLDFLTLWGGVTMFLLVVAYVVGKRSLYFVPRFAKDLVLAPFRHRNASVSLETSGRPNAPAGRNRELEATAGAQGLDSLEDVDLETQTDIRTSPDAHAGLSESNLEANSAAVRRQAEEIGRAFAESERRAAAAQRSAHPGGWGGQLDGSAVQMQARTAPGAQANLTSASGLGGDAAPNASLTGEGAVEVGERGGAAGFAPANGSTEDGAAAVGLSEGLPVASGSGEREPSSEAVADDPTETSSISPQAERQASHNPEVVEPVATAGFRAESAVNSTGGQDEIASMNETVLLATAPTGSAAPVDATLSPTPANSDAGTPATRLQLPGRDPPSTPGGATDASSRPVLGQVAFEAGPGAADVTTDDREADFLEGAFAAATARSERIKGRSEPHLTEALGGAAEEAATSAEQPVGAGTDADAAGCRSDDGTDQCAPLPNGPAAAPSGGEEGEAPAAEPLAAWLGDDDGLEYQEPARDVSTPLSEEAWLGSRDRDARDAEPNTRQEDTELGIFRPDDA